MVTIYSKPGCVQCNATYRALDSKGKSYRIIDVSQDDAAMEKVKGLGYQQVPVIIPSFKQEVYDADGNRVGHWGGFIPDYLNQL